MTTAETVVSLALGPWQWPLITDHGEVTLLGGLDSGPGTLPFSRRPRSTSSQSSRLVFPRRYLSRSVSNGASYVFLFRSP